MARRTGKPPSRLPRTSMKTRPKFLPLPKKSFTSRRQVLERNGQNANLEAPALHQEPGAALGAMARYRDLPRDRLRHHGSRLGPGRRGHDPRPALSRVLLPAGFSVALGIDRGRHHGKPVDDDYVDCNRYYP